LGIFQITTAISFGFPQYYYYRRLCGCGQGDRYEGYFESAQESLYCKDSIKKTFCLFFVIFFFQVTVRNYADFLWSSYNTYCKTEFDKSPCDSSKIANSATHIRSPELFHELIEADNEGRNIVQPFYNELSKPCKNARKYFHRYLADNLFKNGLQKLSFVVSGEDIDMNPLQVAHRLARILGHNIKNLDLIKLFKMKMSNQELLNYKNNQHDILDSYTQTKYSISKYRVMLNKTRLILDQCWSEDCVRTARLCHYRYPSCFSSPIDTSMSIINSIVAISPNLADFTRNDL
jgi:hypothetical protein